MNCRANVWLFTVGAIWFCVLVGMASHVTKFLRDGVVITLCHLKCYKVSRSVVDIEHSNWYSPCKTRDNSCGYIGLTTFHS